MLPLPRSVPFVVAPLCALLGCAGMPMTMPAPDGAADAPADLAPGDGGLDAPGDGGLDAPGGDGATDAGADAPLDADPRQFVAVSHPREFRGVWIATVYNINFPSRAGLSAAAQRAELVALLDLAARLELNAVVFQVRPESDALYRSTLEPWSRFLTGTQGRDPGYDPLAVLVEEAHRRGIEVHAWFNPYRAKASASSTAAATHVSVTMREHARMYDGQLWMDPGARRVQDHTLAVVEDVTRRYDIDGVHFDDYFYPYPADGVDFPDDDSYRAYRAAGGTLARDDWRRDNVNRLVERVSASVAAIKRHVRFGISPFGIYRPGMPPGITGLDQYASLYADPLRWMNEGWVDYLAPQLYWPTTQTAQSYRRLLPWWAGIAQEGRYIFVGNSLANLGMSDAWTLDEIRTQVSLTREHHDRSALGNIYYHAGPLRTNRMGVADMLRTEFYQRPALTPPIAALRDVAVAPPHVTAEGTTVSVRPGSDAPLRAWVVYREVGARWVIERVVPAAQASFELPAGRWAVTAAARHGVESQGVLVEVR